MYKSYMSIQTCVTFSSRVNKQQHFLVLSTEYWCHQATRFYQQLPGQWTCTCYSVALSVFPSPPWLARCSHAPVALCLDKLCRHTPASPRWKPKRSAGWFTPEMHGLFENAVKIWMITAGTSIETSIFPRKWGMIILQHGGFSNSFLSQTVRVVLRITPPSCEATRPQWKLHLECRLPQ